MSQTHDNTYTGRRPNGGAERKPLQQAEAKQKKTEAKQRAEQKKAQAKKWAEQKKHEAKGKSEQKKHEAKEMAEKVKHDPRVKRARARAEEKAQEARSFAYDQAREHQAQAATRVSNVASAMRAAGRDLSERDEPMAEYADLAGDKVDDFARYLSERDPEQLVMQAEAGARDNPALFIGGAFALGFLGGRFLKAGAKRRNDGAIAMGGEADAQLPAQTSSAQEGDHGYR